MKTVTSKYTQLTGVTAINHRDAWAFGSTYRGSSNNYWQEPLAYHWNGKTWTSTSLPKGLHGLAFRGSSSSSSNVWAVSSPGEGPGGGPNAVLHWNGKKWSIAKNDLPGFATGVTALSPNNVWVFGSPGAEQGSGTWHFNGHSWSQIKTGSFYATSASATSAKDIWALGRDSTPGQDGHTIGHYNGKSWKTISLGASVAGIHAASAHDVWATTCLSGKKPANTLLHWDGHTWHKSAAPGTTCLREVTPDGHAGYWFASGDLYKSNSVLYHRTSSGKWSTTLISHPKGSVVGIQDLVRVPGTSSLLGAGYFATWSKNGGRESSIGAIFGYGL